LFVADWPGNVRELRNVLERTTIPCEDGLIRADDLSIATGPRRADKDATYLAAVERNTIQRTMQETSGNEIRAAQQLGTSRSQLYTRLRKHGLAV
jgi:transcriptional regulator of acetoin/glycerol metabolism